MSRERKLPRGVSRRARDGKLLAQAYVRATGKRKTKVFGPREVRAAANWKRDTEVALARGEIAPGVSPTFRKASTMLLEGMKDGSVRTRSRTQFKPGTVKRYKRSFDGYLLDELGSFKLDEITLGRLERLVAKLQARGLAANTIRNEMVPALVLYRWAKRREYVTVDPTLDLELPLGDGRRDRFATPAEARLLVGALHPKDQPLWAMAFYTGLRRGELMALRWDRVDLASGVVWVSRSYDPETGATGEPKSSAGKRPVQIPGVLRELLLAHKMRASEVQPLVFARSALAGRRRGPDGPFSDSGVTGRARRRWKAQGLESITLHECRHSYAALMIAAMTEAGKFNAKRLQHLMGHSSITTTYDRYGHLFPGEDESGVQLQAYIDSQTASQTASEDTYMGSIEPERVVS